MLSLTTLLFCLGFALSPNVSLVLVNVRRVEVVLLAAVAVVGLILQRWGEESCKARQPASTRLNGD